MKKVFIDLGHGGTDPGAVGNKLFEKVLTRKIGEYMKAYLEMVYEGVLIRLSRNGDETKSLKERTDDANAWGADVLASIHINSATSKTANGFESHIYPNAGAPTVALQNLIHSEIMQVMKAFGINNDRGKKQSDFHMLRESNMNACLTENLFIVNAYDANRLKQEEFLKAVGEAHARGVAKFLGLKAKVVVSTKKEEIDMYEKAIVVGTHPADLSAAEILQLKTGAPIYFKNAVKGKQVAKEILVVGGTAEGLVADKITPLTGKDRREVMNAVYNY